MFFCVLVWDSNKIKMLLQSSCCSCQKLNIAPLTTITTSWKSCVCRPSVFELLTLLQTLLRSSPGRRCWSRSEVQLCFESMKLVETLYIGALPAKKCCSFLKSFWTPGLFGKSSPARSNETQQLVEWSSRLTRVITAAILFILFIELSYSVFTPECDSSALWATVRWIVGASAYGWGDSWRGGQGEGEMKWLLIRNKHAARSSVWFWDHTGSRRRKILITQTSL